jgi:glycerol kinase
MNRIRRKLVLAIDQGTTSTRCLTFDSKGAIAHAASQEFPQIYPHAGWVEHNPEDIYESVVSCIGRLNLDPYDEIISVGITNQRETIVAWDRSTGKPFHNAIVWLDTRTSDLVRLETETSSLGANKYRKITGLPISTYFSSMKIRWLIENVPAVSDALAKDSCCFGTIDSFLANRLTNGEKHVTDCTNASRYNLMDIRTLSWSDEICQSLNIPISSLPTIVSNSEIVGTVTAIPSLKGVPITSLIGDQHAALLGHGCIQKNQCKVTYGTGCFLLMNTGHIPTDSASGSLLTTLAFKLGADSPPQYALEGSVAAAGRSVQWAKENLRIGDDLKEFNEIASSVQDTCGVTFVPAFSGLFAPYWRDDARAVIVGMSLRSSYRHIARAILEATALQCAEIVKLIQSDAKLPPQSVRSIVTDGGMTKSDLLMKIQADILDVEVKRTSMTETTAFGAAYAAGLSVGFWDDVSLDEIKSHQGGYDSFTCSMNDLERSKTFFRWEDAVKRSLDLAKFANLD